MSITFSQSMTILVVSAGLLSALSILVRRHKSNGDVLFAIFCGSVAMAMLRSSIEGQSAWLLWGVTLASCATCNMYWLVSRNLFRGERGVQREHVAAAIGIALMIMAYRAAENMGSSNYVQWTSILGALLTLTSSTVLVLAFIEALRGWSSALPPVEKRLRLTFMVVFGSCVLAGTISGALVERMPELGSIRQIITHACALLIILFTHVALYIRRRNPLQDAIAVENAKPVATDIKPEDYRLADAIRHQLEVLQVFREPELKVADLAGQLNTAEYKASRVISQVLGERNFNQMVNRYRITHACQLLEIANSTQSVLDISMECGFASLGPFNRAFKAAMGVTPSVYRNNIIRKDCD
jgi:AraC-like DNA-binding protein